MLYRENGEDGAPIGEFVGFGEYVDGLLARSTQYIRLAEGEEMERDEGRLLGKSLMCEIIAHELDMLFATWVPA